MIFATHEMVFRVRYYPQSTIWRTGSLVTTDFAICAVVPHEEDFFAFKCVQFCRLPPHPFVHSSIWFANTLADWLAEWKQKQKKQTTTN